MASYFYVPPASLRVMHLFRLQRWCPRCNDWVSLMHLHRGPDARTRLFRHKLD